MSDNSLPKRKGIRLKDFDYSFCGTYFLTICTKDRRNYFGNIVGAPIVNQFKGYVTKRIGFSVWQKLYYDHVIRDDEDYNTKWEYIETNPMTWCIRNEN